MIKLGSEELPQLGRERQPLVEVGARILIVLLLAATSIALMLRTHAGPVELAFLPICVTVWFGADLLTAILLLSQFNVDGKVSLVIVASAYLFTGLMSLPYLLVFPGIFFASNAQTLQVSVWLFSIWHIAFPACLATGQLMGFRSGAPTVERRWNGIFIAGCMMLVVAGVAAVTGTIWTLRDALPVLVLSHGRFAPLYSHVITPTIVAANAAAFLLLAGPRRNRAPLQSWLAIAVLAAMLDAFLNAMSPGRYSVPWYAGKFMATLTSTALLFLLLVDIASLYRRLFDVASQDSLTGLANRNGLQERMPGMLADARSGKGDVALLLIDIDYFKKYNDTFGHAAGDDALRLVSALFAQPLRRTSDVVARIGGEEFMVLLPATSAQGALLVGERIRADVEAADITNPAVPLGKVTVSIGVSIAQNSSETPAKELFSNADRALYRAKAAGRNRVVLESELHTVEAPEPALVPAARVLGWYALVLRLKQSREEGASATRRKG